MTKLPGRGLLLAATTLLFAYAATADGPGEVRTDAGPAASVYGPITYDPSGNVIGIGSSDGVTNTYFYDPMSRLVSSSVQRSGNAFSQGYVYDVYGNRTAVTGTGAGTFPVSATTNQLTAASYDSSGNLTSWIPDGSVAARTYMYDSLNVMKHQQTPASGGTVNLDIVYTADDERYWVFREQNAVNSGTFTIRDLSGKVLREYEEPSGGTLTVHRDYLYRNGQLLAAVGPSEEHHYSLDHLGTPRIVTDANAHRVAEHTYYGFGEELTDGSPTDGPLRFTGHERDEDPRGETNAMLDYMHARYYSPEMGRFLSVDPNAFWRLQYGDDEDQQKFQDHLSRPQSWNRYSYVENNPLRYIDPDGRERLQPYHFNRQPVPDRGWKAETIYVAKVASVVGGFLFGVPAAANVLSRIGLFGSTFTPAISTTGATLTAAQAARVSTVNEIVHNWNARGTLQATGQVLAQHAQKIREGMAGLQKAATAIQNSLNNPNLDPKNRAVLEKALQTAQKYMKDADEALKRAQ